MSTPYQTRSTETFNYRIRSMSMDSSPSSDTRSEDMSSSRPDYALSIRSRQGSLMSAKKKRSSGPRGGSSRHTSCEGCRSHKTKCDRTTNCSSCRIRGDLCIWQGANPVKAGTPNDFPEASTRAQREIARLRNIIRAMAARSGIDPEDPTLLQRASEEESMDTGRVSRGESCDETTSVDMESSYAESMDEKEKDSSVKPEPLTPLVRSTPRVYATGDSPSREEKPTVLDHTTPASFTSIPIINAPAPTVLHPVDLSQQQVFRQEAYDPNELLRPTVKIMTSELNSLPSPIFESPSITPTSFRASCQNGVDPWFSHTLEVRTHWPSAMDPPPNQYYYAF